MMRIRSISSPPVQLNIVKVDWLCVIFLIILNYKVENNHVIRKSVNPTNRGTKEIKTSLNRTQ